MTQVAAVEMPAAGYTFTQNDHAASKPAVSLQSQLCAEASWMTVSLRLNSKPHPVMRASPVGHLTFGDTVGTS